MDRFFIAPYDKNSGQQTNIKPWLIPDEAFQELSNAYVFRGRVRKRFGTRWMGDTSLQSRFRIAIGVTAGGDLSGNVRTLIADAGMTPAVGQGFSVLGTFFTVYNSTPGPQQMYRTDGSLDPATYDLSNSDFNITGTGAPDGTPVYFYPALPVMGLLTFETASINSEFLIGFDTRYAYQYSSGWERLAGEADVGAAVWTGSNSQFFWGETYTGANASDLVYFVTNFNENEPNFMRYFDPNTLLWHNYNPLIEGGNHLVSARILVIFKNRLLAFNTWEGGGSPINYRNRLRFTWTGDPLDTNAWNPTATDANFVDATTTESIVTVEFVKDRLIVYFERSTWEVVYTSNYLYPFLWQKINTELGVESTFSIVPFDTVAIGVGNVGIHACTGANVDRIDEKIPDAVFAIHNTESGVERVYGIRDYYVEMVYWTFPAPDASSTFPYPNRVLVYNYKTGTWAFNDDSITVFGYFQPTQGILWDSTTITWDDTVSWDGGPTQALFRQVIGGNQEGYTFICDADLPTTAPLLQITNVSISSLTVTITAIDHNFRRQEYVYLDGLTGDFSALNQQIFEVINVLDKDSFTILVPSSPGTTYNGGGLIARVSNIIIRTKEYNFYAQQGRNAYIQKVDFMVDRTGYGQTQVQFFSSTTTTPLLEDGLYGGIVLGTGTLDTFAYPTIPFEATASRVWHPVYFQAEGEVVQFVLQMNDAQMRDVNIRNSGFALHAMCIFAMPTSYRLQ